MGRRTAFARLLGLLLATPGCLDPSAAGNLVPRTVAERDDLPTHELADGTLLHLQRAGDPANPTIIVLHGGPGGDHRGLQWLSELSSQYHVVMWDQRGTGLSERVPYAEIGPRAVSDVLEIAGTFSPDAPVNLIGYSWGGTLAAGIIADSPSRVGQVVLLEPGALSAALFPDSNVDTVQFTSQWLNEAMWTYDILATDDDARQDYLYSVAFIDSVRDDDVHPTFWRWGVTAFRSTWTHLIDDDFDFTRGFTELESEALFIAGAARRDGKVGLGAGFQRRQVERVENARLVEIEGAAHTLIATHRAQVLRAIQDYLDAFGGPRRR